MSLALSKVFDPIDYRELESELAIVNKYFTLEREQHEHRRWEYAMAIRAINTWRAETRRDPNVIYDVGGAGSPFRHMYPPIQVIDPDEPGGYELENFCGAGTELAHVVTCLSVLEHIADLDHFCYLLGCLVAPGGLLFLTFDYALDGYKGWPAPDHYHFHWMRKQIFNSWGRRYLHQLFVRFQFSEFGVESLAEPDTPAVYDYTFASLALVKRS